MRHADDGLFDTRLARLLHQHIEQRDEAISTLEREALLAHVLGVQVALQPLGRGQLPEDVLLLRGAEAKLHPRRLKLILQPQPLVAVRHMREFSADGVGINEFESARECP